MKAPDRGPRVDIIAGARPNFVKIAPIIKAIHAGNKSSGQLRYRLVHTGQHYDARMSGDFFEQLGIPEPNANLDVGSGTQAEQTAAIMVRYERLLRDDPSELCLVVGDVNSTMACAIAARKLGVEVAHVEAGIRSGDWTMPEEINRVVTDSIANWFFTTSRSAGSNLVHSGIDRNRIVFVGNTMVDSLLANLNRLRPPSFWQQLGLESGKYIVVTLHRPSNVDQSVNFSRLMKAICEHTQGLPILFPVHPRTRKILGDFDAPSESVHFVDPQPYLEFNYLVKNAKAVITDSGGITEETTVMGVPCLTVRDTTERPETVTVGTNEIVGTDPAIIGAALNILFYGKWKIGGIPELWDGRTGQRIADHLETILAS